MIRGPSFPLLPWAKHKSGGVPTEAPSSKTLSHHQATGPLTCFWPCAVDRSQRKKNKECARTITVDTEPPLLANTQQCCPNHIVLTDLLFFLIKKMFLISNICIDHHDHWMGAVDFAEICCVILYTQLIQTILLVDFYDYWITEISKKGDTSVTLCKGVSFFFLNKPLKLKRLNESCHSLRTYINVRITVTAAISSNRTGHGRWPRPPWVCSCLSFSFLFRSL